MNPLLKTKYKNKKEPIYQALFEDIKKARSNAQLRGMLSSSPADNILRNLYLAAFENLFEAYIQSCKEMVELSLLSVGLEEEDLMNDYKSMLNTEKDCLYNHLSNTVWFKEQNILQIYREDFRDRESRAQRRLEEFIGEEKAGELNKSHEILAPTPTTTTIIQGDIINATNVLKGSPITIKKPDDIPLYKKFIFKVSVGVTIAFILFMASLYKSDFVSILFPGRSEKINNTQDDISGKSSKLTDEQKNLLALLNKYRMEFKLDTLIIGWDGYLYIEKESPVKKTEHNLMAEVFSLQIPNHNYKEDFRKLLYSIPNDYIRFIPEMRVDCYVVQLTEEGKNFK